MCVASSAAIVAVCFRMCDVVLFALCANCIIARAPILCISRLCVWNMLLDLFVFWFLFRVHATIEVVAVHCCVVLFVAMLWLCHELIMRRWFRKKLSFEHCHIARMFWSVDPSSYCSCTYFCLCRTNNVEHQFHSIKNQSRLLLVEFVVV